MASEAAEIGLPYLLVGEPKGRAGAALLDGWARPLCYYKSLFYFDLPDQGMDGLIAFW